MGFCVRTTFIINMGNNMGSLTLNPSFFLFSPNVSSVLRFLRSLPNPHPTLLLCGCGHYNRFCLGDGLAQLVLCEDGETCVDISNLGRGPPEKLTPFSWAITGADIASLIVTCIGENRQQSLGYIFRKSGVDHNHTNESLYLCHCLACVERRLIGSRLDQCFHSSE